MARANNYLPNPAIPGLGFVWIPFLIATAVSAGSSGAGLWSGANRVKAGQKLAASNFADEAERYLQENVRAWQQLPDDQKNQTTKGAAVEIFYYWWHQLEEKCATLGEAGTRCINERKRGGVNSWGADWFQLYLDPIEQYQVPVNPVSSTAPSVTVNTNGGTSVTGNNTGTSTTVVNPPVSLAGGINPMVLLIGLVGLYWVTKK